MASFCHTRQLSPAEKREHFEFMLKFWRSVAKKTKNWMPVAVSKIGYYQKVLAAEVLS